MQIAQALSGFSAGKADILRKAMGKKKSAEMDRQKKDFIEGAVKNNIPREQAIYIFQLVVHLPNMVLTKVMQLPML